MVDPQIGIRLVSMSTEKTLADLTALCASVGIVHDEQSSLALVQTDSHLELQKRDEPKLGAVFVDFISGAMAHRRKFGGGRGEAVAKAVGVKGNELPTVIDATAGLGRDSFDRLSGAFGRATSGGAFITAGRLKSCLSGRRNRRNLATKSSAIECSPY